MIDPVDFSFDEDRHEYRDAHGVIRPSVTQCLKAAGFFNYDNVPKDVLENARRRGQNIHKWTSEYDNYGFIDDTWLSDDEQAGFEAWLRFRSEIKPRIVTIEKGMMGKIADIEIAGTPDREAYIGATRYVLDLKCCASGDPVWGLQLCLYEMLLTGRPRCGHLGRMSVRLLPTARYSITTYENTSDADAAIAAVVLTEWDGQASSYNADHARDTLNAWKSNHNLKAA